MDLHAILESALRSGESVRIHTDSGEVLVARLLGCDRQSVRYLVVHSSRPENYAVCDSTGFELELARIERAVPVGRRPRGARQVSR